MSLRRPACMGGRDGRTSTVTRVIVVPFIACSRDGCTTIWPESLWSHPTHRLTGILWCRRPACMGGRDGRTSTVTGVIVVPFIACSRDGCTTI